mgnify:CR=1 FL=1
MISFAKLLIDLMKKTTILFFFLIFCSNTILGQENSIYDAIKKRQIIDTSYAPDLSTSDALNNTLVTFTPIKKKSISELFLNNLSLGVSYGISEFKGDIKQDGFINSTNTNTLYNFRLTKKINPIFSISSEILFGDLSGSKETESYLISETQSTEAHDPYDFYEGLGEKFTADFFEFDLITSINLESVIKHYYSKYSDNNRFDICYNIGFGILSFKSIKRNNESDTYIYGYGYKDLEGEYESAKGFFERPKARVISYGYSVSYLINSRIKCTFLFLGRLTDTDFLDSSMMNQQNDKFRNISLGIDYIF